MHSYLYEDCFEGLLSALALALSEGAPACEFVTTDPGLLFGPIRVATDPAVATGLLDQVRKLAGEESVHRVCQAPLAERPDPGGVLFAYLQTLFEAGRNVDGWRTNAAVREVLERVRLVGAEAHKFKGLLRFMELRDGTYYAPFEPDHRIILPVAHYFTQRLADQHWVIHDRKRDVALLWDGRALQAADFAGAGDPRDWVSDAERHFQDCWRTYTRHIAIDERRNPRLQAQFMPRRYWQYLPEMNAL